MSKFTELYKIDVNKDVEKKNGFNYLSWTYAWKTLQSHAPEATYEVTRFNGLPVCFFPDGSAQVEVTVTVDGVARTMWLAVTDFKNQAVKNPSSVDIANSTMRCFVKAIAMHGLGLYIYAGEDIPQMPAEPKQPSYDDVLQRVDKAINACDNIEAVETLWTSKMIPYIKDMSSDLKDKCEMIYTNKRNEINGSVG
tara:strand:- start:878 stop:1462 length:585 start_codon:yes stop_codon:yes gene_type:complete